MILDQAPRPHLPRDRPVRGVRNRAFISGFVTVNMTNVHDRTIVAPVSRVGALLDTLGLSRRQILAARELAACKTQSAAPPNLKSRATLVFEQNDSIP